MVEIPTWRNTVGNTACWPENRTFPDFHPEKIENFPIFSPQTPAPFTESRAKTPKNRSAIFPCKFVPKSPKFAPKRPVRLKSAAKTPKNRSPFPSPPPAEIEKTATTEEEEEAAIAAERGRKIAAGGGRSASDRLPAARRRSRLARRTAGPSATTTGRPGDFNQVDPSLICKASYVYVLNKVTSATVATHRSFSTKPQVASFQTPSPIFAQNFAGFSQISAQILSDRVPKPLF